MLEINFKNLNNSNINLNSDFGKKVISFIEEWFSDTKTVKVQTSGSTGTPKIFEIEKDKMLNSAEMTCNFLDLKDGDTALLCLPTEYISGKMMMVRSIFRNLKLKVVEPSSKPLENLETEIDFCAMTPLQVENSLDKIHLINNLIIGGAAVSVGLKKKIYEALLENPTTNNRQPTTVYETYGMSETLSHIALKQVFPVAQDYFQVFDGIEISKDERGCLRIFAPKINSEILQTNDLVEIKNEKEFRFLGRIDNVINSGGAKIFPEELEAIVKKEIPNEAVFMGIPDEVLGEKLILIIEGEELGAIKYQLSTINYTKSFHKPKEIIFIEKIPRFPNGKTDRISLKNLVLNSKK